MASVLCACNLFLRVTVGGNCLPAVRPSEFWPGADDVGTWYGMESQGQIAQHLFTLPRSGLGSAESWARIDERRPLVMWTGRPMMRAQGQTSFMGELAKWPARSVCFLIAARTTQQWATGLKKKRKKKMQTGILDHWRRQKGKGEVDRRRGMCIIFVIFWPLTAPDDLLLFALLWFERKYVQ